MILKEFNFYLGNYEENDLNNNVKWINNTYAMYKYIFG